MAWSRGTPYMGYINIFGSIKGTVFNLSVSYFVIKFVLQNTFNSQNFCFCNFVRKCNTYANEEQSIKKNSPVVKVGFLITAITATTICSHSKNSKNIHFIIKICFIKFVSKLTLCKVFLRLARNGLR